MCSKDIPFEAYTGSCVPALDSLITFGTKISSKTLSDWPITFHPWTYDGIFLGYQNSMHNIWYWDVYTNTTKTATHDSKDKLQYGDNPDNSSPASEHLMKVFIGDPTKTMDFSPEPIELKLKDVQPQTPNELLTANLNNSPPFLYSSCWSKANKKRKKKICQKNPTFN